MPKEVVIIGLIVLAGLLLGGVYTTWKTAKFMAGILLVLALLAGGGAVAWYLSST
ncbi:hypothetical protein [Actinokineospora enzanensis]|uniref:hypothetical protein n=1 Tax=Actinokineospora enzanensis TaxID=155975 RepID=UPI000378B5EE|nr:hypothetical protein [Actinokineospora enzanensis]